MTDAPKNHPESPASTGRLLSDQELHSALEAMLLVVTAPTSAESFAEAIEQPVARVRTSLRRLAKELTDRNSGMELREVSDCSDQGTTTGWRLYTRADQAWAVRGVLREQGRTKLSGAALETLAIAAYRQPVTRSVINSIRGVESDGVLRSLIARDLLSAVGTEPGTGAILYSTTEVFLEHLGIASLAELPSLEPFLPGLHEVEDVLHDPRLLKIPEIEPTPLIWDADAD